MAAGATTMNRRQMGARGRKVRTAAGETMKGAPADWLIRAESRTAFARRLEVASADHEGALLLELVGHAGTTREDLVAFERMVAAVSFLGEPGVLAAVAVVAAEDGHPVVVSPLPPGKTLARFLADGQSTPPRRALEMLEVLARALEAAHARGICHGALSVDHVFLTDGADGGPRLLGFGQRWLARRDAWGPQVASDGRGSRGERAGDVRALARVAELLLTPAELRVAGVERSFGTSPAVTSVIGEVLAANDGRCPSPTALVLRLASAVAADGRPIDRHPATETRRPRAAPPVPKLVTGLVVGISFAVVAALGVAVWDPVGVGAAILPAPVRAVLAWLDGSAPSS
jgi:hypothetical protein